jgi:hypothetical protein
LRKEGLTQKVAEVAEAVDEDGAHAAAEDFFARRFHRFRRFESRFSVPGDNLRSSAQSADLNHDSSVSFVFSVVDHPLCRSFSLR